MRTIHRVAIVGAVVLCVAVSAPPAAAQGCDGLRHCYSAGVFTAELTHLTVSETPESSASPYRFLLAHLRFRNTTDQPIALGYVSAVMTDDAGNRYGVRPATADGATGIGTVTRNEADSRFVLGPRGVGSATLSVSRLRGRTEPIGTTFTLAMTVVHLEVTSGQQVRTVREYSVNLMGLTAPPVAAGAPASQDEGCGGKAHCFSDGVFSAEVTSLVPSERRAAASSAHHVLQANVVFRNLTQQPIILGYVANTALIVDSQGNRYTIAEYRSREDGAAGIGTVERGKADPRFMLAPGASGNATFTLSLSVRRTQPVGPAFHLDFVVSRLDIIQGGQVRNLRAHAVTFPGLTPAGGGLKGIVDALKGGR